MKRRSVWLLGVLVFVAGACAEPADVSEPSEPTTPAGASETVSTLQDVDGPGRLMEWVSNGTVIQVPDGQAVICTPGVMGSLPPQCGGPPIVGLDWADVPWAEEAQGVVWADVRLVGTFDGTGFELTRPPEPVPAVDFDDEFDTTPPCPEPSGGWVIIDPTTAENDSVAVQYAQAQGSFLGNWVHRLPAGSDAYSVKVFTFSDDVDEHRSRLREIYGGPLCVAEAPYSYAELDALRAEVRDALITPDALAAGIYGSVPRDPGRFTGGDTVDVIQARVEVWVFAAVPGAQEWVDDRFGPGVVKIYSQLQAVEG